MFSTAGLIFSPPSVLAELKYQKRSQWYTNSIRDGMDIARLLRIISTQGLIGGSAEKLSKFQYFMEIISSIFSGNFIVNHRLIISLAHVMCGCWLDE